MTHLTNGTLDVQAALQAVGGTHLGGTALFLGSVRQSEEDGPVEAIEYSAYEDMAETEFERILNEVAGLFPGARVLVTHRLGRVPLGDASIIVAAAAPHRDEAFRACRHIIEEVKRRVPIWKKEIYQDGSAAWRGNDGSRGPAAGSSK